MINFYAMSVVGSESRGSVSNPEERRDDRGVDQTGKDPSLPARLEGQDVDRDPTSSRRQQWIHLPELLLPGLHGTQENRRVVACLYSRQHVAAIHRARRSRRHLARSYSLEPAI